jgi:hypothetical protein
MGRLGVAALLVGMIAGSAAAEEGMIGLTPLPGVAVQVPAGWKACDDVNDKALGSAADPMGVAPQICNPHKANPEFKFGTFAAAPGKTASALFFQSATVPITAEGVAALTDDVLKAIGDELKKDRTEALAKVGGTVEDFQVRKDTLGGQAALVTLLLQTVKQGQLSAQVYTETWEVPYGGSYYSISFIWPKTLASIAKPDVDRVKASVKFGP